MSVTTGCLGVGRTLPPCVTTEGIAGSGCTAGAGSICRRDVEYAEVKIFQYLLAPSVLSTLPAELKTDPPLAMPLLPV